MSFAENPNMTEVHTSAHLRCQYLYFCTSKASKLSNLVRWQELHACTFVLCTSKAFALLHQ